MSRERRRLTEGLLDSSGSAPGRGIPDAVPDNGNRRRAALEIFIITALALILRFRYMAPYPGGWDDVDFALALDRFDLSLMQPHFPGYPVYILVAHLFYAFMGESFHALAALSAAAGGFTVVPLWLLFRRLGSPGTARLATVLYAATPLSVVSGIQPTSDALGSLLAAALACFAWMAAQRNGRAGMRCTSLIAGGFTLGLLLGVRVSYAALSAVLLWTAVCVAADAALPLRRRLMAAGGALAAAGITTAAWVAALALTEGGLGPLLKLGEAFTAGHFEDWGGAYHAGSPLAPRAAIMAFRQIGAAGLGTLWPGSGGLRWAATAAVLLAAAGLAAAAAARLRERRGRPAQRRARALPDAAASMPQTGAAPGAHAQPTAQGNGPAGPFSCPPAWGRGAFLLMWIAPYLVWAFFAQNIDKPRHILPLLPPLLFLLAAGMNRAAAMLAAALQRRPRGAAAGLGTLHRALFAALGALWLAVEAGVSLPLAAEAHRQVSPMVQLARYVQEKVPAQNSLIFTWEEQRVLQYMTPAHTVVRLRRWEDLRTEALQAPKLPERIYATNVLIEGMDRPVGTMFTKIKEFSGSPWLYPTYHTIGLYEGNAKLYEAIRTDGKED